MLRNTDTGILAARILAALKTRTPLAPISEGEPAFDLADAYAISADITARRIKRGEFPVGWKIGFTNRTIWSEFGVRAPIWGPMYDTSVFEVPVGAGAECALATLMEPRIEPEIAFRFAASPVPGMPAAELIACLDGVAHGFEIVQSVYPGWKFQAADTVAACALHGRYFHRPFVPIHEADRDAWFSRLSDFGITLIRNGESVDRGRSENVLGGPLEALAHFVDGLDVHGAGARVKAGEIVTTGTVTRALPVAAGETWSTALDGLPLTPMEIRFV